jgi:hypothetical protein
MKKPSLTSPGSDATESRRQVLSSHSLDSTPPFTPPRAHTLAIDMVGMELNASVPDALGRMVVDRVWIDTPFPCPPKVLVKALVELVKTFPAYEGVRGVSAIA